jgi:mannose-6-phosphate isomerase-like protein (cupin superfamily)
MPYKRIEPRFRDSTMRHVSIVLLALGLAAQSAHAQDPRMTKAWHAPAVRPQSPAAVKDAAEKRRRRLDFIEGATVTAEASWLAKHRSVGTPLLTSGDEQTEYILVRRTTSSQPEVHARWDDVVLVRSGTGAIETGDSLVGSTYRAPGERAGGKLTKSSQLIVRAGDIVRIPAAVPHAFIVAGTEPLEYMVIKQRRQELPIRWFAGR